MRKSRTFTIYFLLVFTLLYTSNSKAQYSFSPSKTLIKNQSFNSLSYDSIHIANNSSDTLFLNWELLQYDTLGGSYIEFCSSGNCWLGIPATGSFPAIEPGGFGWAGVHFWTASLTVTCTAKIYIYKEHSLTNGDTLTYILNALHGNGIEKNDQLKNSITVYPNPASDKVSILFENNKAEEIPVSLYNILGEIVYSTSCNKSFIEIPLESISKGIYFIKISSGNGDYVKKIVVSK